ncbi:MAG: mechanosensitive ion channel [Vicingaceae bacterium]
MKMNIKYVVITAWLITSSFVAFTQANNPLKDTQNVTSDSTKSKVDSTALKLEELSKIFSENEKKRIADSIRKADLLEQIKLLRENDDLKKKQLEEKLKSIEKNDSIRKAQQKAKILELKAKTIGYPVAPFGDTLFMIYTKSGSIKPKERAERITKKITALYDQGFDVDSFKIEYAEHSGDIIYKDDILLSISEFDAQWMDKDVETLTQEYFNIITSALKKHQEENAFLRVLMRIGLIVLIMIGFWLVIKLISKLFVKTANWLTLKKGTFFKGIKFNNYEFLNADRELNYALKINTLVKWGLIALTLYITLPLIFSVFPFTRGWAEYLFGLIFNPAKRIVLSFWHYLPNLITITVIYFATKYVVKFFAFLANEIKTGNLKIKGFYPDWALPTFNIVRFLLYVFMFIVIFPYLPGSDSPIFQGVSVFLGVLVSFGSSSAISNTVAGIVITYMRPFKIGDRIKVGDVTGDVIQKTLLVTRIKTIKNEEITVPNANVLSSYTINYSSSAKEEGLIVHTTVTIGYDVPWRKMHEVLINAALKTPLIEQEPKPFVLQTSLDDFYVSYQINAYTKHAAKQAKIYSDLHQNIQDECFANDIEILSPHFRAMRDGNFLNVPAEYLPKDYKPASFNIKIEKE